MADRQRAQASARAAVAAVALLAGWLGLAGSACTRETLAAETLPAGGTAGLRVAQSGAVPAALSSAPADAGFARRAAVTSERFRARITHWTEEARKLSKGKAHAGNVHVAVSVRELGSEAELVALRADAAQPPASNMKLVTTAAALILLGRDAEWVTPVEASVPLRAGELAGNLIVRAAGDPLWDPGGRGEVEPRLAALVRELRAAGLTRVRGDLVLDEESFAPPAPGPGWPDASQHWSEYCARSGGFSANGGVLHALVRAGAVGGAARIAVHPAPHGLEQSYSVRTVAGSAVDVRVGATTSTATVRGTLGAKLGEYEAEFAHPDPVALFGTLLTHALRQGGIALDGTLRRARGTAHGTVLAELRSPLAACLEGINSDSRNGLADQVFLSLGHALTGQGTRAGGARAVELALERLGVPHGEWVQVDGSGLSRDDRVNARGITALLQRVLGAEAGSARLYRDSLAVMGQRGTLEERLRGTSAEGHVFAKTGWISGVSSLSGYAEPPGGRAAVFSILVEYPSELGGLNASCFKKLQDELVTLLFQTGS